LGKEGKSIDEVVIEDKRVIKMERVGIVGIFEGQ
jgi:hypothetical protein